MPRVLVILAEGFEELEAITVTDLFVRADIDVVRAGLTNGNITASRNSVIVPDCELDAVIQENFDMIVLPGGLPGADYLANDDRVIHLVRHYAKHNKFVAAICAAPRVLAKADVLAGKSITCYPGALEKYDISNFTLGDTAVCVDLPFITSRGPGTAMDFALTLVGLLKGEAVRDEVEQGLARST
ncbi:MAG: DJ-1/PfpI family protein [Agarilytica sp.]